nr:hypothetical protein CFP56_71679 [Quercus suber]
MRLACCLSEMRREKGRRNEPQMVFEHEFWKTCENSGTLVLTLALGVVWDETGRRSFSQECPRAPRNRAFHGIEKFSKSGKSRVTREPKGMIPLISSDGV